ncbi:MAG: winged helix-turn-helix transcriptional regulator [Nitrososphaerota archaeon]|jgi:DNA-binding transcriptional ArsR family regulator|nr:winged helix-turn-helix transcriptional regulator [Nitrososphaerota archaeon]MDG7037418.1 winged helix-turn-helix transcriptional regulator [Nitrososphaerota archaeon]MDG7045927.1 winged helix-turn-helix transcriptional regulator [Nitrososphaerota archaeon]
MNPEKLFPEELKESLIALSDDNRGKILMTLSDAKHGLSYTQLLERVELRKGNLTHHLKVLMKAGLVRNFSKKRLRGPYDSYYEVTNFGNRMINAVYSAVLPHKGYRRNELTSRLSPYNKVPEVMSVIPNALLYRLQFKVPSPTGSITGTSTEMITPFVQR